MTRPAQARQGAAAVLVVRPAQFGYNAQTAASNRFQNQPGEADVRALARAEFDALVLQLRAAGVQVCCIEDSAAPIKPDAVFPNNWVSFHADGTVVLYPMEANNRRLERSAGIVASACAALGFEQRQCLDLTAHEGAQRYLEGTGSLVLDHLQRIAFAARSSRTDPELARAWARARGYELVLFDAVGEDGTPIYHTNVLLAIGTRWAVVCAEAIEASQRDAVLARLAMADRHVLHISAHCMREFAGNMLELTGQCAGHSHRVLAVSARARAALAAAGQWDTLRQHVDATVVAAIPTIEQVGGGSVRCMLAEVPVHGVA